VTGQFNCRDRCVPKCNLGTRTGTVEQRTRPIAGVVRNSFAARALSLLPSRFAFYVADPIRSHSSFPSALGQGLSLSNGVLRNSSFPPRRNAAREREAGLSMARHGSKKRLLFVHKIDKIGGMPTTVSISEAKQRLGEIADRAIEGEQIVIIRKSQLLVLKRLEMPEPVPLRPQGYFDDCYDKAAVRESNKLAARSTRHIVK
jgi:hypothetical protein